MKNAKRVDICRVAGSDAGFRPHHASDLASNPAF
jgi:hypothetical protein